MELLSLEPYYGTEPLLTTSTTIIRHSKLDISYIAIGGETLHKDLATYICWRFYLGNQLITNSTYIWKCHPPHTITENTMLISPSPYCYIVQYFYNSWLCTVWMLKSQCDRYMDSKYFHIDCPLSKFINNLARDLVLLEELSISYAMIFGIPNHTSRYKIQQHFCSLHLKHSSIRLWSQCVS